MPNVPHSLGPLQKSIAPRWPVCLALLTACFFFFSVATPVAAAQGSNSTAEKPAQKKKKAKKEATGKNQPAKATFLPSSQEPTSVRNARLKRECKGRVNAGACAGFTQ